MYGVKFGDKHSFDDFHLLLLSKTIGAPGVKTNYVSIPGRNGDLDLSEANGGVRYSDRKITLKFRTTETLSDMSWANLLSTISAYLHGKKMRIAFDDDEQYFYLGRCEIVKHTIRRSVSEFQIECKCDPYKYDIWSSTDEWEWDPFSFEYGIIYAGKFFVDGSITTKLVNRCMPVAPVFITTAPMTLAIGDNTYQLPTGRTKLFDFELPGGETEATFRGTGEVQVLYRGGTL